MVLGAHTTQTRLPTELACQLVGSVTLIRLLA